MEIALLNNSVRYRNNSGILRRIAQAVNQQLSQHVAPLWGMRSWGCVFYDDVRKAPRDSFRLWVLDDADQAGVLGYHGQDPEGYPYGRVFVNPIINRGGTDMVGARSVSVVVSHEACEVMVDPEINCWRQMSNGRLTCQEICDAVQGDFYNISTGDGPVAVSNFLLPPWFDYAPVVGSRYDYLGKLKSPFTMSRGGWMLVMNGGILGRRFGSLEAEQEFLQDESKRHEAARGIRRGLLLTSEGQKKSGFEAPSNLAKYLDGKIKDRFGVTA